MKATFLSLACAGLIALSPLAAVAGTSDPEASRAGEEAPAGPGGGAEETSAQGIPIAVLPLGLTARTAERYPQLADHNVGLGVHNVLVNHLYDSGRFRFVEEKKEVVDDLLERQWVATSGAVSPESAVSYGRLLGARYVLYGEVYDFSVRRVKKKVGETRIALQIRLVDVETSEYVPAAGSGTAAGKGAAFVKVDPGDFARSTIGQATDEALGQAVAQLMERFHPGN